MSALALSHTESAEAAEAALYVKLQHLPVTVHLNGFPESDWHKIVGRLDKRYRAVHLGPNTWEVISSKVIPTEAGHRFLITVASGRFDAKGSAVHAAFLREAHAGASLIFTTEQDAKDRTAALHLPGYGIIRNTSGVFKGENAVEFDHADWELVDQGTWELNGGGAPRGRMQFPGYAAWGILRNKHTGRLLLAVAVHMPAHLFPGSKLYNPAFIKLWWASLAQLHQHIAKVRQANPGIAVAVGGDWNVQQSAQWFVNALHKAIPGAQDGKGYLFGNVWTVGLQKFGASTIQAAGSSDHLIKRLHYGWAK